MSPEGLVSLLRYKDDPELEKVVSAKVESGRYNSVSKRTGWSLWSDLCTQTRERRRNTRFQTLFLMSCSIASRSTLLSLV
jgi:hypothetical protein